MCSAGRRSTGADGVPGLADRHRQDASSSARTSSTSASSTPSTRASQWIGNVRWRVRAVRGDEFNQRINGLPVVAARRVEPGLQLDEPGDHERPDQARRHRLGRLLGRQRELARAPDDAGIHVEREPDARRRGRRALPRRDLHGQAVPEPRVHGRSRRQPRVGAAARRPARAAADRRRRRPPRAPATSATAQETSELHATTATRSTPTEQQARRRRRRPSPATSRRSRARRRAGRADRSVAARQRRPAATAHHASAAILGPPVSLWDVDWPQSGYYWTVIPVVARRRRRSDDVVAAPGAPKGATTIPVAGHDRLPRRRRDHDRRRRRTSTPARSRASAPARSRSHAATTHRASGRRPVVTQPAARSRTWTWSLPQDVCAAGRVQRFGISSEPSLTSAQAPFATGLSSDRPAHLGGAHVGVLRRAARRLDAGASAPTSTRCSTRRRRIRSSRDRPAVEA